MVYKFILVDVYYMYNDYYLYTYLYYTSKNVSGFIYHSIKQLIFDHNGC